VLKSTEGFCFDEHHQHQITTSTNNSSSNNNNVISTARDHAAKQDANQQDEKQSMLEEACGHWRSGMTGQWWLRLTTSQQMHVRCLPKLTPLPPFANSLNTTSNGAACG